MADSTTGQGVYDFFQDVHKQKENIVFLDMHNFAFRYIFSAQQEYLKSIIDPHQQVDKNDLYIFWKTGILQGMFNFIKQFSANKVIIAVDSKHNWRKDFYSDYKGDRKEKKDASPIDFKEFYPIMNEFIEQLKTLLTNVYVFQCKDCEADDIIAILSKDHFKDDNVTIVSTDRDFKQLLQYPHIKIFNPDSRTNDYMSSPEPRQELNIKVMCGDSGDCVPNILVMPDNYKGIGERTIGVGEVAAQKILEEGLDSVYTIDKVYDKYNEYDKKTKKYTEQISKEKIKELVKQNYQRNLKLISFDHIPVEIKNKILEEFKKYTLTPLNTKNVYNYLQTNRINKVAEDFQIYSPVLKRLG